MKIFAKRKKTPTKAVDASPSSAANSVKSPSSASGAKKNKINSSQQTFASDATVQELLKKDSSEWNAKEKRMIKRYQERQVNSPGDDNTPATANENSPEDGTPTRMPPPGKDGEKNNNDNTQPSKETEETDDASSSNENELEETKEPKKQAKETAGRSLEIESILEKSTFGALNSKQRRKFSRMLANNGKNAIDEIVKEANEIVGAQSETTKPAPNENPTADSKQTPQETSSTLDMAQVQELLKNLNSKQRRTLSRRLERDGEACLADVKKEAEQLLQENSNEAATPQDNDNANNTLSEIDSSGKKRKRRHGPADLSGLTPEERLRREEQRKKQKEAAEQKARGEDAPTEFRHPLNSERRRANRRKPKWVPKKAVSVNSNKIEHNASGYQARKRKHES